MLIQSKVLERHEETIARHTKIQSVTAIAAVIVTILTTMALASITFLQLRANERQVMLEEARSANRYSAKIEYRTPRGTATRYTYGWQPVVPYSLSISRASGDSTVTSLVVFQKMELHTSVDSLKKKDFNGCVVLVADWFEGDPQTFATPLTSGADRIFENMVYASPNNQSIIMDAAETEIYVRYFDVYGNEKTDEIILYSEDMKVNRDIHPNNDPVDFVPVEYQPGQEVPYRAIFSDNLGICEGLITPSTS